MKTSDLIIEGLAICGKVRVENSSLSEKEKEFAKFGIDLDKEFLKEIIKTPKKKILDYAKLCGIKKLTIFTYMFNNVYYTLSHIEGKNIEDFCNLLDIKLLTPQENSTVENCINNNIFILCGMEDFFID